MSVGMALLVLASVLMICGKRKIGLWTLGAGIAGLWIMSSGLMLSWVGGHLERMYPPAPVEEMPKVDVIVVLGGGMGSNTNGFHYAEMWSGADCIWHAVRLYKAGKAPKILISGCSELYSSLPLLLDFGVPREDIIVENVSRNTEENAKYVAGLLSDRQNPKILLVTSAWHMRRAHLMFQKYTQGIEVIPSATDHETLTQFDRPLRALDYWQMILPGSENLSRMGYMIKEYVGCWGYRYLR